MAYLDEIFNAAMALMDELDAKGQAQTADTQEYANRAPSVVNQMTAEYKLLTGDGEAWAACEDLEDYVPVDATYALGVMIYGLAANLLTDENPTAASFYQQRYEEMRNLYINKRRADTGEIENVYGGFEHNEFGRW